MSNTITANNEMFISACKNMYARGELTLEQYAESLRRGSNKDLFINPAGRIVFSLITNKILFWAELQLEYAGG